MRPWRLAVLASLLVVASCTPDDDDVGDPDWCQYYDFTVDNYGFSVSDGYWSDVGYGLGSDSNGALSVSYSHTEIVTPSTILVYVSRPPGVDGNINIDAAGQIYGVPLSSQQLPTALDEGIVQLRPAQLGDGAATINASLLTVDPNQSFWITKVEVFGMGVSPFESNPCDKRTATPSSTPNPTFTPGTPTSSPTPGDTTPSATAATTTPDATPSCTEGGYDFAITRSQSIIINGVEVQATWPGGHLSTPLEVGDSVAITSDTSLAPGGGNPRSYLVPGIYALDEDVTFTISVVATSNVWYPMADLGGARSAQALSSATIYDWVGFGYNGGGAISASWAITSISGPPACPSPTSTPIPMTLLPTYTATRTPMPMTTPIAGTPTRTPMPMTLLPGTPSRTPIPMVTPSPRPSTTPIPMTLLPTVFIPTNTPGGPTEPPATIDATPYYATGTPNATPTTIGGSPVASVTPGLPPQIGPGYGDGQGDIGSGVSNALATIQGLGDSLTSWMGLSIGRLNGLIDSYWAAPPAAIPGLPRCMSAPMDHDICAIYYIMRHTFFRANTPGQWILPLGQIVLGLVLLVLSVRYVLFLVRNGQEAIQQS